MPTQERNSHAAQQRGNAIAEDRRTAVVSAYASQRDYGRDLSIYFSDSAVELVNCRVQGKN
ncbi:MULTISPECIES: hypothetical protein [unclassified Paraburkholderia]|uniref:hypothetical protein n=1 Tax=unclassified Paraburkholderia TaxID=2615204 RepID=UPI002AB13CC6|nr:MULTISPECIES: hypothetical protein [unclassified Paraburkholderia]